VGQQGEFNESVQLPSFFFLFFVYFQSSNGVLRQVKRNFLGDILHSLTGVATDEQLQQQMRLDEEIREQVVSLLHHQAITDKGVTDMLSAVAREEDNLSDRLGTLQQQHDQDISSSNRLLAFLSIVTSDIRLLECTLSSMSAGIAPPLPVLTSFSEKWFVDLLPLQVLAHFSHCKGSVCGVHKHSLHRV